MKMNNIMCSSLYLYLCLEENIPNTVRGLEAALGRAVL